LHAINNLQFVYALKVGDAVIKAKPCQAKQLFQRFYIFPAGFAWGFLGGGGVFFCEKKCHRGKVSRLRPSLTWQCNSSLLPRHANDDGSAGLRMQSRKSEAKAGCKIGGKSEENRGKRDGYRWVVGGGGRLGVGGMLNVFANIYSMYSCANNYAFICATFEWRTTMTM